MRFWVYGANEDTGREVTVHFDCETKAVAERKARQAGILVAAVEVCSDDASEAAAPSHPPARVRLSYSPRISTTIKRLVTHRWQRLPNFCFIPFSIVAGWCALCLDMSWVLVGMCGLVVLALSAALHFRLTRPLPRRRFLVPSIITSLNLLVLVAVCWIVHFADSTRAGIDAIAGTSEPQLLSLGAGQSRPPGTGLGEGFVKAVMASLDRHAIEGDWYWSKSSAASAFTKPDYSEPYILTAFKDQTFVLRRHNPSTAEEIVNGLLGVKDSVRGKWVPLGNMRWRMTVTDGGAAPGLEAMIPAAGDVWIAKAEIQGGKEALVLENAGFYGREPYFRDLRTK